MAGADATAAVRGPDADTGRLLGGPSGPEAAAPAVRAVGPVVADWPLLAPEPRRSPEFLPGVCVGLCVLWTRLPHFCSWFDRVVLTHARVTTGGAVSLQSDRVLCIG